ncbi:MAG: excinuclease ABC subunit A, partial [Ilumatobacteraceae bacterium]
MAPNTTSTAKSASRPAVKNTGSTAAKKSAAKKSAAKKTSAAAAKDQAAGRARRSAARAAAGEAPVITVRGAREHNLKNVSVEVPRDRLVVFTGLSGSGKSSLAFDTIYAEGQRRYVESLSSYARQFLG